MFEPLIRATLAGFAILNADRAVFTEYPTERAPGSIACEFALVPGPFGCIGIHPPPDVLANEFIIWLDYERYFCSWGYSVQMHCSAPATFEVSFCGNELGGTINAQAGAGPLIQRAFAADPNPCDINLDGTFNVLDFMAFLNAPYDWNGDGHSDSSDFAAVLAGCS